MRQDVGGGQDRESSQATRRLTGRVVEPPRTVGAGLIPEGPTSIGLGCPATPILGGLRRSAQPDRDHCRDRFPWRFPSVGCSGRRDGRRLTDVHLGGVDSGCTFRMASPFPPPTEVPSCPGFGPTNSPS